MTVPVHGDARGLESVLIEVRNDLPQPGSGFAVGRAPGTLLTNAKIDNAVNDGPT
jgi:predicted N-formylglutamate amidohydrolase